jgi:hypothetical protein
MDDILERRAPPPSLRELTDFQTSVSDMFGRFQRCYNDEQDLARILSTRERRRCDDLRRARDENSYILSRQENIRRICELTLERDEACQNVAIPADELSHLRQEVCMNNASIIELRQRLALQDRQVLGARLDDSSTTLDRTGSLRPPRDRHQALQAYVEALTVSRAVAFSKLALVRQEMGRLATLSYMHRSHSRATGVDATPMKPGARTNGTFLTRYQISWSYAPWKNRRARAGLFAHLDLWCFSLVTHRNFFKSWQGSHGLPSTDSKEVCYHGSHPRGMSHCSL